MWYMGRFNFNYLCCPKKWIPNSLKLYVGFVSRGVFLGFVCFINLPAFQGGLWPMQQAGRLTRSVPLQQQHHLPIGSRVERNGEYVGRQWWKISTSLPGSSFWIACEPFAQKSTLGANKLVPNWQTNLVSWCICVYGNLFSLVFRRFIWNCVFSASLSLSRYVRLEDFLMERRHDLCVGPVFWSLFGFVQASFPRMVKYFVINSVLLFYCTSWLTSGQL